MAVLLCSGDIRYYERLKQFYHVLIKYTLSQKKTIHLTLTFDHNFSNCRQIYKILSLSDYEEILYSHDIKIYHLTLKTLRNDFFYQID